MKNNNYITLDVELTTLDIAVLDQLGADYTDNGNTVTLADDAYSRLCDMSRYGVVGGFNGFIYYSETVKFAKANFEAIKDSLTELYDSMGEDIIEGLKNWGCLSTHNLTTWEICEALYAEGEWETQVYNALAWYAAEETARKLADAEEIEEDDDVEEYDNFPTWALPRAVYGEDDTLTDEEKQLIDNWLDGRTVESWDETSSFTWSPAFGKACDCCTVHLYPAD